VEPSSTGDSRRQGALPIPEVGGQYIRGHEYGDEVVKKLGDCPLR
jgi:hypothetical protein